MNETARTSGSCMDNFPDLNDELGRLFCFVAETAAAIRMNTAYNSASEHDPNARVDAMWLADALHNLGRLGSAVSRGSIDAVQQAVGGQIRVFERYLVDESGHNSKAAFARWERLCHLREAIAILRQMNDKCMAART